MRRARSRPALDTVRDVAADVPARLAAIAAVEASGDPAAVATLCAVLDDPQPEIRFRAAQVLARLADPAAVDALCGRFSLIVGGSWPSADEVAVLASALSRFRDDPRPAELIRPALLEMWVYVPRTDHDMDYTLATDCITPALERLGGLRLVVDAYADALRHDDEGIRRNAARDLMNIVWREGTSFGDRITAAEEDAVRAVLRTAEADASEHVRRYVNDALKMLDDPDLRH
jgi:HEAT repeat protein